MTFDIPLTTTRYDATPRATLPLPRLIISLHGVGIDIVIVRCPVKLTLNIRSITWIAHRSRIGVSFYRTDPGIVFKYSGQRNEPAARNFASSGNDIKGRDTHSFASYRPKLLYVVCLCSRNIDYYVIHDTLLLRGILFVPRTTDAYIVLDIYISIPIFVELIE